jgi:hypothetical protein
MFDRSVRLADMPGEQRLLNLNMAINTPDRRMGATQRAFVWIGFASGTWLVFFGGLWLVGAL